MIIVIVFSDILNGEPLELDIQGLEYMNDDPDEVDVLYAMVCPIDRSERYLEIPFLVYSSSVICIVFLKHYFISRCSLY